MSAPSSKTFGPFYISNVISAGDVSELFLASMFVADGTRQNVALRRVRTEDKRGAQINAAVLDGATRYAVLHHLNIVEVKDLGMLEGKSYVATEFIRGRSLLAALSACGRLGLGFPTDVAIYITRNILDALGYTHALKRKDGQPLGIVHGDLRHSNILLSHDGAVRVSDFEVGIGSTHHKSDSGVSVGGRHGFFSYLAPEQARGERADPRCDIFALGILLYEQVTGRHLFSDKDEDALLDRIRQAAFELPIARYRPDLHPELESIIRTALAPDPSDRFGSASTFADALTSFLATVNVSTAPSHLRSLMEKLFGPDESESDANEVDSE